jgi:hypothetical protein
MRASRSADLAHLVLAAGWAPGLRSAGISGMAEPPFGVAPPRTAHGRELTYAVPGSAWPGPALQSVAAFPANASCNVQKHVAGAPGELSAEARQVAGSIRHATLLILEAIGQINARAASTR